MDHLLHLDPEAASRFAELGRQLRPLTNPSLFVSRGSAARDMVLCEFDGGRDAAYIVVARRQSQVAARATIGFGLDVPGTHIIYDATAGAMQGKARPFDVDLTVAQARMFALLPVQIESIDLSVKPLPGRVLRVEFHDARGERLQAVLPFHFHIQAPDGKTLKAGHYVTDLDGRFASHPRLLADVPASSRIIVRSQLTGREASAVLAPQN